MREGVKRQEMGDMGKTEDRRRETGDNALTSKAGVRKLNFCFFGINNPSSLHYAQIGLLKVSSVTLSHFLKTSNVSEVTPTAV